MQICTVPHHHTCFTCVFVSSKDVGCDERNKGAVVSGASVVHENYLKNVATVFNLLMPSIQCH